MSIMGHGTNEYILGDVLITIWIQEWFERFFTIASQNKI